MGNMALSIADIERISKEIREYYRIESVNQSIQKIKPNFYNEVKEAIATLSEMATKSVSDSKIESYRKIMDKKEIMEKNLRNFLLKRYEKLLRDSLFDISSKTYEPLAPEEKVFIMENHNRMMNYLDRILKPEDESPDGEGSSEEGIVETEPPEREEKTIQKSKDESSESLPKRNMEDLVPVSVIADYLPLSTSFGDFYLHKADIVYLPSDTTEILVSRKYAKRLNIGKIVKN